LLGKQVMTRHAGLLRSRVLSLNQSLDPAWDQVFVEFNGFYGAHRSKFGPLLELLLEELGRQPDWDEFRLPGLQEPEARLALALAPRLSLNARIVDQRPSWSRELQGNSGQTSVIQQLSANTRQQIRRSMRALESRNGRLMLHQAGSAAEAQDWFQQMAPWHRHRWSGPQAGVSRSGFDNPSFIRFHFALIARAFDSDHIRVWKLFGGEQVVAMMYNFRVGATESFYLGATDPELDPLMRPGLIGHLSVMERCLEEGVGVYDFMAGDAQYKRQLSNRSEQLYWLVLQRPRWRFRLEDRLRQLRSKFSGS
jgi:CelD/BcsL family acetyltransferase involved in cellulose biosynthesis